MGPVLQYTTIQQCSTYLSVEDSNLVAGHVKVLSGVEGRLGVPGIGELDKPEGGSYTADPKITTNVRPRLSRMLNKSSTAEDVHIKKNDNLGFSR